MAIQYTWDVNTVEVYPSHDGNDNVIHTVHWKLKGVDGSYQHTEIGIANLNTADIESFISFDSFKKDRLFQGYLVFGVFLLISIQALFNIAVNIGLLPTKGLTLPFISYGGTSIIIMLSLMGIVLRINNENKVL